MGFWPGWRDGIAVGHVAGVSAEENCFLSSELGLKYKQKEVATAEKLDKNGPGRGAVRLWGAANT